MHFKLLEETTESFVTLLRRMFYGLREVENVDVKVLRFQSKEEPRVAAAFAYDGRHYPAIVVAAQGGNLQTLDLGDYIGAVVDAQEYGKDPRNYSVLSRSRWLAAQFTPSGSMAVERVKAFLQHAGSTSESDITISVRADYGGQPADNVMASGVIKGFHTEEWGYHEAYLETVANLDANTPYWVVLSTESLQFGGEYNVGRQEGYGPNHLWGIRDQDGGWSVNTDSALSLNVLGERYERFGAASRLTIQVSCAAKSDKLAMRLSDLAQMYLFLARKKQSGYLRAQNIHILGIRSGGLIHTTPSEDQPDTVSVARLFVDVRVDFWEDFAVSVLKSLEIEVGAY